MTVHRITRFNSAPGPQLNGVAPTFVGLGKVEVGNALLIETHVPADQDVVLGLRLLQLLVIVRLQLDQGAKDVLVLVRILVSVTRVHTHTRVMG